MTDLKLIFLIKSEKQILDTILCPYGVERLKQSLPVRCCDTKKSLAKLIDLASVLKSNSIIITDLKLIFLIKSEKQILDTILCPYGVERLKQSLPVCCCDKKKSLVDQIITDKTFKFFPPCL